MAPNLFADNEHGLRKGWGSARQVWKRSSKREMNLVQAALNDLVTLQDGTVANHKFTEAELRARGLDDNMIATYHQALRSAHYALDTSAQSLQVKNLWNLLSELYADGPLKGYAKITFTGRIAKGILGASVQEASENAQDVLAPYIEELIDQEADVRANLKEAEQELADAKKEVENDSKLVRTAKTVQIQAASRNRLAKAEKVIAGLKDNLDQIEKLRDRIGNVAEYDNKGGVLKPAAGTMGAIEGIANKVDTLKRRAYFPLMRFGKYTLTVWNVDPKTGRSTGDPAYFGRYETEDEQKAASQDITPTLGENQRLVLGVANENAHELYSKINMDTLALFADYIDTHDEAGESKKQVDLIREYIRIGTADNSALKRQLRRKGTPGWSTDARRVLASYVLSNATMTAGQIHTAEVNGAIAAIPQEQGDVQQYAQSLRDYTQDPGEELSGLRNFMFFWYLGGSLASAAVNLTQVPMVTFPFLSQFGSAASVTRLITAAYATVKRGKLAEQNTPLGRAYKQAELDGIIAPQQIYAMMGTARGGTLGASRFLRHPSVQFLQNLWSTPFGWAEQVNRSVTFIAAFNQAMQGGQTEKQAAAFAKDAVDQTQLVYSKLNRPAWARGVGAPLFTFKLFTIQYLELLSRLPGKQKAQMLGLMLLVAGLGGLPGEEDAEDLIDTIMQVVFGKAWQTRDELKRVAEGLLGETLGQVAVEGISAAGLPIDLRRLGMGNIVPGTGALLPGGAGQLRAAGEVLGPTSGLIQDAMGAVTNIGRGDFGAAAYTLVPKAIRAGIDGVQAMGSGVYEDTKGRSVMPISWTEAGFKAIGFQPRRVAQYQQQKWSLQKRATLQRTMEDAFLDRMARARVAGDDAAYQAARAQVRDWNARNPSDRIEYTRGQILSRVKGIKAMSQDRFLKSLPPELRKEAMGAFGE
jgi:hypothetical protein